MKDWQRIIEYLKLLLNNARYEHYVSALLRIIPLIRDQEGFEGVEPGLTHLTLTLSVSNAVQKVHIDMDSPGTYNVYLDQPIIGSYGGVEIYGERVTVPFEGVVETAHRYLSRLRVAAVGSDTSGA